MSLFSYNFDSVYFIVSKNSNAYAFSNQSPYNNILFSLDVLRKIDKDKLCITLR